MDSLPQELIDRISTHLSGDDLKRTLTLNKTFNAAAEQLSGVFSSFELTQDNSHKFLAIYGGNRFRLLRELVFRTQLPPILDTGLPCRETSEELHEKDACFTSQIRILFTTLKTAEQRAIRLVPATKIIIFGPTRRLNGRSLRTCLHRKFVSSRIHLLDPESLPELPWVRSLELKQGELTAGHWDDIEVSKLDLRMIVDVARKLPRLEFVGCLLGRGEFCPKYTHRSRLWSHYEHDWEGPRRDTRHEFADAVKDFCLPSTLKRIRFDFLGDYDQQLGNLDQIDEMPDLVGSAKRDPFSTSLCILSQSLRILELRGIVDSSLFQCDSEDLTSWPNLESLVVMFWPVSPSGVWYFQGPDGEGEQTASYSVTGNHYPPLAPNTNDFVHDEYLAETGRSGDDLVGGCGFRITPIDAVLVPFLTAFANAASRMPRLKDANLWTPLVWYQNNDDEGAHPDWSRYEHLSNRPLAWGIAYDKPFGATPRKLTWRVSAWRPDAKLHALFRNIGHEQHGNALEEDWTDEQSGDGLVNRDFFSDYEVPP